MLPNIDSRRCICQYLCENDCVSCTTDTRQTQMVPHPSAGQHQSGYPVSCNPAGSYPTAAPLHFAHACSSIPGQSCDQAVHPPMAPTKSGDTPCESQDRWTATLSTLREKTANPLTKNNGRTIMEFEACYS